MVYIREIINMKSSGPIRSGRINLTINPPAYANDAQCLVYTFFSFACSVCILIVYVHYAYRLLYRAIYRWLRFFFHASFQGLTTLRAECVLSGRIYILFRRVFLITQRVRDRIFFFCDDITSIPSHGKGRFPL